MIESTWMIRIGERDRPSIYGSKPQLPTTHSLLFFLVTILCHVNQYYYFLLPTMFHFHTCPPFIYIQISITQNIISPFFAFYSNLSLSLSQMAFAIPIPILAFLLLHPLSATSDLLSPIFDDVCKEVECGKGRCKASNNSTFFFECECNPGWKHTLSNDDDSSFKFLPCVIPNCTLDYSCSEAPAPVQEKAIKSNESIFDACHWVDCGGGSCNKTSMFSYNCECDFGYYNLLNVTSFPCFRECSLGMGCSELGISMTNSSTSTPPAMDDNVKNEGSSILQGSSFCWLVMLIMFMTKLQLH